MKCCMSTDVGTWTNRLTFEPDPDYSLDAGTGLLSPISYKRCYAEFYYVWKIPRIRIGNPSLQRGMVRINGFIYPSHRHTIVGGTYTLPSALLVLYVSYCLFFCGRSFRLRQHACAFGRSDAGRTGAASVHEYECESLLVTVC